MDVAAVTQSEELSSSLFLSSAVAGGGGRDKGRLSGGHPVQVQVSLHPGPLTLLERRSAVEKQKSPALEPAYGHLTQGKPAPHNVDTHTNYHLMF